MKRPVILGGGIALSLTALPTIALAQTAEERLRLLEERLLVVESELQQYKDAAVAQRNAELEAEKNKKPGASVELRPAPRFTSDDKKFSFRLRGRAEMDYAAFNIRKGTRDFNSGTELRRARLGIDGVMFGDWGYRLEADFAGAGRDDSNQQEVDINDAYVRYQPKDAAYFVTLGQHKTPNGLEQLASSPNLTFLERSQASGAFLDRRTAGGDRKFGLSYTHQGESWTATAGIFGQNLALTGAPAGATPIPDESYGVAARLTWAPIQEETRWVHVGASGYYRETKGQKAIRFGDRPEVRVDNVRTVDTGNVAADSYYFAGAEAAAAFGPFSLQAEYMATWVDRPTGPKVNFDGGYVAVAYVLTGETVTYSKGVVEGIKPKANFSPSAGGWGAWQIAARYSFVDLNDLNVLGGKEENITAALNWWLNPNLRASFNYVRFDAKRQGARTAGDAFAFRVGVVW
jgi:phosphate-selective porin OprO/OprP